ncbi:MAG: heavy metal-binding domain-containing protein [Candidatus Thermoplasmatota archaeon]|nr:heavy metal-binding domain-containing protein [Candidatus Thermoplasmatota archaeon]
MHYRTNRVRTLAIALLSVLAFSVVVSAQGVVEERPEEEPPLILFIVLCCTGPWILLSLFWVLYSLAYPPMFIIGAIFGGRKLEKRINAVVLRERSSIEHFGKDPLSTLKGSHIVGGVNNSGLVYSSIVYAPSHWMLLIAWFNNLIGGRIDILQRSVAAARSEAKQLLRERAKEAGWDEVLNVRIDTAEMAPGGRNSIVRGAVEVFAYGTGVKYG